MNHMCAPMNPKCKCVVWKIGIRMDFELLLILKQATSSVTK